MTRICPHCGRGWPEKKPYEYTGWLKPHLNLILTALRSGMDVGLVAESIVSLYDPSRDMFVAPSIRAAVRHIAKRYGFTYENDTMRKVFWNARREHAFLLRCEGLTYPQIGKKLGCSSTMARAHVQRFSHELARRTKHTKFTLMESEACRTMTQ